MVEKSVLDEKKNFACGQKSHAKLQLELVQRVHAANEQIYLPFFNFSAAFVSEYLSILF